jgi:hypothetical protein
MPQIKIVTLENLSSDFVANTSTRELHVNPAQVVKPYLKTLNGNEVYGTGNLSVTDLGADPSGTASSLVNAHNNDPNAHQDIRDRVEVVNGRFVNYDTSETVDLKDSLVLNWTDTNFVKKSDIGNYKNPIYVGASPTPITTVKEFVTQVQTDSDGLAVINFASAGFTQILSVQITCESQETGTAAGNAAWGCYFKGTLTNTSMQIRTKSANSAGLLAAMVAVNVSALANIRILGV